jgi:hypothetical protein
MHRSYRFYWFCRVWQIQFERPFRIHPKLQSLCEQKAKIKRFAYTVLYAVPRPF